MFEGGYRYLDYYWGHWIMLNGIVGLLGTGTPAVTNSYESIATVTVGSGGVSSLSFASIPSTFKHLQLRSIQRNTTGGTGIQIGLVTFNSDTGSNYARHNLVGNGSSASASAATSTTAVWAGVQPQAGELANSFGASVVDILDYANTNKYKTTRTLEGFDLNGSGEVNFRSGLWQSTAAINEIRVTASSGNIAQYSVFALYGIKG
jgi:hypothetical protein